jgi:16S rRNA processing protein RimM
MSVEFLAIGRVVRPHGVRGELVLEMMTDFPERLSEVDTVYLGEAAEPHPLASARRHRKQLLLRLADCHDRDCADAYRGQLVRIRAEARPPLPPGRYYHHELLGLQAVTETGESLGELVDILETGANDVWVVNGPDGEILLPAIPDVIREVDLTGGRIVVHLMEGLR